MNKLQVLSNIQPYKRYAIVQQYVSEKWITGVAFLTDIQGRFELHSYFCSNERL
jgi:hypothetical protein